MLISTSLRRKIIATLVVAIGLVFFYETTAIDSRYAARLFQADVPGGAVVKAASSTVEGRDPLRFTATAYCKGHTTASGVAVRTGIAAADPDLLPVGSVIQVDNILQDYKGVWTIMDTGPKVHGRHIDLYVWSCHEALAFGRRPVQVSVLRLGWSPRNSTPALIKRLFQQNEETLPPPPVWPPVTKVSDQEPTAGDAVPAVAPATGSAAADKPLPAVPALATPAPVVKKPGGGQ
jgi:3D (Asp-Asp-Asp) domain-containing protein